MQEEPIDSNEELEDSSQQEDSSSVSLECRWKAEQEYGQLYHSVVEWKENSYYE